VRKLSDAATGCIAELGGSSLTVDGSISLQASTSPPPIRDTYFFGSRGTSTVSFIVSNFTSPATNILTGIADIAAPNAILRVDGTQVASGTATQGTGNYLTNPLFIGRRLGTSNPYNGRIYGLLVRFGANLSAAQIAQAEAFMAAKTGVTIP
jgi:hypothetical protein